MRGRSYSAQPQGVHDALTGSQGSLNKWNIVEEDEVAGEQVQVQIPNAENDEMTRADAGSVRTGACGGNSSGGTVVSQPVGGATATEKPFIKNNK